MPETSPPRDEIRRRIIDQSRLDMSAEDHSHHNIYNLQQGGELHTGARVHIGDVNNYSTERKRREETLFYGIGISLDATHNQAASDDLKKMCCVNTRKAILKKLLDWCENQDEPLCWVKEKAGMGKTTLLHTLCKGLEEKRILGASFFCSSDTPGRRNLKRIIPTIAFQFAHPSEKNPLFAAALYKDLLKTSEFLESQTSPKDQLEKLIIEPLMANGQLTLGGGKKNVIVLDALDECDGDPFFLLESLLRLCQTNLPFKIIIASRPKPAIQSAFDDLSYRPTLFDLEKSQPEDATDVKTYFADRLRTLGPPDIDSLATIAGPVFTVAAALVEYLRPAAIIRLRELQQSPIQNLKGVWDKIDGLYRHILSKAFQELEAAEKERMRRILFTVICAREPMTAVTIAELWDIDKPEEIKEALSPFHSILTIPEEVNHSITASHSTVYEFITSPSIQSEYFWCHPEKFNAELADRCLQVMNDILEHSIRGLPSSSTDHSISLVLRYSCHFWAEHLGLSEDDQIQPLRPKLDIFLRKHIFHWFELLSRVDKLEVATRTLDILLGMIASEADSDLYELIYHSFRFIDMAFEAIRIDASSARSSALDFIPSSSPLRRHYARLWDQPNRLRAICGVHTSWSQWGPNAIITNHGNKVTSITISPDGDRLFARRQNQTICAWNARTRKLEFDDLNKAPYTISDASEQKYPPPLAVSSCSRFVISRCTDFMRVWEINSRKPAFDLKLKPEMATTVNAVAVSPEGDLVCSGGDDGVIHIWNISNGKLLYSLPVDLDDRKGPVSSISFGPNKNQIVSGSLSGSAFIWNSRSRTIEYILNRHTKAISSVATSAKSKKAVIGSDDHTISLWNDRGGEIRVLEGHGDKPVKCVTFFSDGTKFASGGADGSLIVWNVENGEKLFLFERSNPVTSIAVFPDGVRIASSAGTEIAIWNLRGRQTIGSPPGQRLLAGPTQTSKAMRWNGTESMVFSPDGGAVLLLPSLRLLDTRTLEEKVAFPDLPETKKFVVGAMRANLLVAATKRTIYVWRLPEVGASSLSSHMTIDIPGPSVQTNLTQPESRKKVQIIVTYEHACTAIDISSDGKKIVSASNDFMVWVWSAETGEKLLGLEHTKPNNRVARAAFSTDGSRIAAAANNSAFHIWDANNGNLLFHFPLRTDLGAINFSPDNHHIIGLRFRSVKQVLVWEVNNASTEPVRKHDGFMHWTMLSSGVSYTYKDGWIWQANNLDSPPQQRYWIPLHYRPNVKVFGPTFTSCEEGVQVCLGREDGMVTLTFPASS